MSQFVIMSAFRQGLSQEENLKRHHALDATLGRGIELFAAAEGRTVDSLYREAQNIAATEYGRGLI
ncbi:hypothetical protein [Ralstonia phage phiITL-1]|uniref:Uncharacterized protein n=1 Tax=Ralstonia phage phiITL-1 TaxID=1597967 RepID=A0A0U1ZDQ4_9CAUD|nr:SAM-dependent methyltransferase [Ralstonia phage phiITL-1]AJT60803.1 hypothetical protein [Ralstonia phage phiITL-1]